MGRGRICSAAAFVCGAAGRSDISGKVKCCWRRPGMPPQLVAAEAKIVQHSTPSMRQSLVLAVGNNMTMLIRGLGALTVAAILSGCGANPAWDNTQATMDPHDRFAAEMKAKQDAAPPIPTTPKPVAAVPAPATTGSTAQAQTQPPAPKAQ